MSGSVNPDFGHLGNAEGDHAEVALKTWLDDKR